MQLKREPERAFAMLEYSLAFLTMLLVVSAAIDVTKFLQAYQALQVGVQSSLRKCYVTDGGCISPKEVLTSSLLKIWQKPIEGFEQDYSANGWYMELPNIRYETPSAIVLTSGQSSYARIKDELFLQTYPAEADIYYGLQLSDLPTLSSFSFRQSPDFAGGPLKELDVSACTIKNGEGRIVKSIEQVSGFTSSSTPERIGEFTCKINGPLKANEDRYEKCVQDYGSHTNCDASWKTGTRIAISIEGEGHGESAPDGKISLNLSQRGNNLLKGDRQDKDCEGTNCDYGGRVFTGWGSFNFVPRGLPTSHIDESLLKGDGYDEFRKHSYIWVRYGDEFTISLRLNRLETAGEGTVAWNVTKLKIFYVEYSANSEKAPCASYMKKSELLSGKTCASSSLKRPYLKSLTGYSPVADYSQPLQVTTGQGSCLDPIKKNENRKSSMCVNLVQSKTCDVDYVYKSEYNEGLCGSFNDKTFLCPENFGISEQEARSVKSDGRRVLIDSPAAATACPIQSSDDLLQNAKLISTTWYESTRQLPAVRETLDAQDCIMLRNPSLPAPYDKYAQLNTGSHTIIGTTKIGLGSKLDPRVEKLRDERYQCSEVNAGSTGYSAKNIIDYGCDWATTEEVLVRDAMRMPSDYFFEARDKQRSAMQIREIYYPSPSTLDACTDYEIKSDIEHLDKRTYLGLFSDGEIPASCTPIDPKKPTSKQTSPAGMWCFFQTEGSVQAGGGGFEIGDIQTAAGIGMKAIQKFFPAARLNCDSEGPYCVKFGAPLPHVVNGKQVFQASASMKVPLNLMLGGNVPINVTDSRTWEGEFAR